MGFNHLHSNSLEQVLSEVDQRYAGRQDLTNISKSVELLTTGEPDCFELAWRLSRAYFFLGQESPHLKAARSLHAAGVDAGRRAEKLQSDRVEGHFWLGVNLALLARLEPPAKAVAKVLRAKAALQSAIIIDPGYHAAGPLRVLARLQHQLPRFMGGGVKLARANFERAIAIAPANTVTRIYFAELLLAIGETDRARAELEHVLSAALDPDWAFEIARDQLLAKEKLGTHESLKRSK